MSGPPLLIASQGQAASPATYTIPGTQEIRLSSVHATFDGSAAGGAFLPCLSIYAQSGELLSRTFPGTGAVAAGSSAEVSYFPFPPSATSSAASSVATYVYYQLDTTLAGVVVDNTDTGIPLSLRRAGGPQAALLSYEASTRRVVIDVSGGHTRWRISGSGYLTPDVLPTTTFGRIGMSLSGAAPVGAGSAQLSADIKILSTGTPLGPQLACSMTLMIGSDQLAAYYPTTPHPGVGLRAFHRTGVNWSMGNGLANDFQLGWEYLGAV